MLAVAALGLTACGGDAEGEPGSSAPASSAVAAETATPTPTPSATPEYKPASADGPAENVPVPKMPKKAKEESEEGLKAYTLYWYDVLNYTYESGDLVPLEAITAESCRRCGEVGKIISDWHSEGRWMVGGGAKIHGTGTDYVKDADGAYQMAVQLTPLEVQYYQADGTLHAEEPKQDAGLDILVARYEKGAWETLNVGVAGEM